MTGTDPFVALAGTDVADPRANGFHGEIPAGSVALSLVKATGPAAGVAEGSGCRVVLDGELYNREQLADGRRNASDAEIVLNAYLRDGERVVERLRGEFALVISDGRKDLVL